jgi:hypothetical protein
MLKQMAAVLALFLPQSALHAQAMRTQSIAAVARRSATATPPTSYTPSTLVMIENRARTLGKTASASGQAYFYVDSRALVGKTGEQVLERLAPAPVNAGDFLRTLEIVVALERPLVVRTVGGQPVVIGAATVAPGVRNIEVHSSIISSEITVIGR